MNIQFFIVLECPDESWIDVFVENPIFSKYQQSTKEEEMVDYIVHFSPEFVINNEKYREWMRKFGSKTEHLIVNEKNTGYASEAMHKMQNQLNLIHPKIFPLFYQCEEPAEEVRLIYYIFIIYSIFHQSSTLNLFYSKIMKFLLFIVAKL